MTKVLTAIGWQARIKGADGKPAGTIALRRGDIIPEDRLAPGELDRAALFVVDARSEVGRAARAAAVARSRQSSLDGAPMAFIPVPGTEGAEPVGFSGQAAGAVPVGNPPSLTPHGGTISSPPQGDPSVVTAAGQPTTGDPDAAALVAAVSGTPTPPPQGGSAQEVPSSSALRDMKRADIIALGSQLGLGSTEEVDQIGTIPEIADAIEVKIGRKQPDPPAS